MKAKSVLLYLGIISYLLAIAEHLLNLGMLTWLYSGGSETSVSISLVILGTVFLLAYVGILRRKKGIDFSIGRIYRPSWATRDYDYSTDDYGVEWHLHVPPSIEKTSRPWADGPYCPKCKRELEEEKTGRLSKKLVWSCPICERVFERPEGDVKLTVEKNFAAYLRKKGEM